MPPTSEHKPSQFAFVLSKSEADMLADLAAREEMSKANLLRQWIRTEYLKAFPDKRPKAVIPVTLRALVSDLTAPEHRTVRQIAGRMAIDPTRLVHFIERVSIKTGGRVLARVDGAGADATWELLLSRERALKAIALAGFEPDEPLVVVNPDAVK